MELGLLALVPCGKPWPEISPLAYQVHCRVHNRNVDACQVMAGLRRSDTLLAVQALGLVPQAGA
jgi:hypothetical protein